MTQICDAALHLCRIRVTRLNELGLPIAGPNNVYVSDKPIELVVKPVIEAGQQKTLVGGCDCVIADYRGFDKLKRFDLELGQGVIEPALLEMLLGTSAVLDGAGDAIGGWWPSQLTCSYVHWVWPSTRWQISDHTLQNDFLMPRVTGFSRSNPEWGDGIFGDYPEPAEPLGGFFYTTTIPAATCDWQSWAIT
jgi:hypothetical protein